MSAREPITAEQARSADFRVGALLGIASKLAALGEHVSRLPRADVIDEVERLCRVLGGLDGEVRAAGGPPLVDDATRSIWSTHWSEVADRADVTHGGAR